MKSNDQLQLRIRDLELEAEDYRLCIRKLNEDLNKHRELLIIHLNRFDELNLIIETLKK